MTDEDDEPSPDFLAAVNLWKATGHKALKETDGDELAALILMQSWRASDPELDNACKLVDWLLWALNEFEPTMKKEVREMRGIIGTRPRLKLIQGGKA